MHKISVVIHYPAISHTVNVFIEFR